MTNIIFLNLGYFLVFLALAIREIRCLRITITAGQSTLFNYSILNGKADVMRDGNIIASLERGQFIVEINYITGKPTSAEVIVQDKIIFYTWNRDSLDLLSKSKPAIMGKLDRIPTLDMAGKLTD
jgi:hypothetical protein